jgi:hypothetical protein
MQQELLDQQQAEEAAEAEGAGPKSNLPAPRASHNDKYDVNFAGHKTFLNFMMSTLDKNLVEVGTRTAVMKSSASQWKQGSMFC